MSGWWIIFHSVSHKKTRAAIDKNSRLYSVRAFWQHRLIVTEPNLLNTNYETCDTNYTKLAFPRNIGTALPQSQKNYLLTTVEVVWKASSTIVSSRCAAANVKTAKIFFQPDLMLWAWTQTDKKRRLRSKFRDKFVTPFRPATTPFARCTAPPCLGFAARCDASWCARRAAESLFESCGKSRFRVIRGRRHIDFWRASNKALREQLNSFKFALERETGSVIVLSMSQIREIALFSARRYRKLNKNARRSDQIRSVNHVKPTIPIDSTE